MILKEILEAIPALLKLLPKKKPSIGVADCFDELMKIDGTDRVVILQVENGGEVLGEDRPMYLTVLHERNTKRVERLPQFRKVEVDDYYKRKMLQLKQQKYMSVHFGDLHDRHKNSMMYRLFREYGTNYAEFTRLTNEKGRMQFVVMCTVDIEKNPFEGHRQHIEVQMDLLRRLKL